MVTHVLRHKQKWVSPGLQAFLDVVKEVFTTPAAKRSAIR
jgi:hypothetical protein